MNIDEWMNKQEDGYIDYRKNPEQGWKLYYKYYLYCGGCDPAYSLFSYVAKKKKYTLNQRYWLAFLYGNTYCDPTAYAIMEKIKDFESFSIKEMWDFWKQNKNNLLFVSDRAKFKNFDTFPKAFESFKQLTNNSPKDAYHKFVNTNDTPEERYQKVYDFSINISSFGRFTLFNFLESLNNITDLDIKPHKLELEDAESCRNGLCYAINAFDQVTLHHKKPETTIDYNMLYKKLEETKKDLQEAYPEIDVNYFNIETALCGYKKLFWGSRYLGYYIDRHCAGLKWMEDHNPDIDFSLLWDFRKKYVPDFFRIENQGVYNIRKERNKIFKNTGNFIFYNEEMPEFKYKNLMPHLRRIKDE